MKNIMRIIYLIRVLEGESGDNEVKVIFKEIMIMNVLELMKNMSLQIMMYSIFKVE